MEYDERLTAIDDEVRRLGYAFRAVHRTARVPTCPDWTLADLAAHVGQFAALWTHVLCEASGSEKTPYAPLGADDDMADWFEPLANHLLDALRATTADAPCWTWIPDEQNAGCVARRAANELSFHRYDAQSAGGATTQLDPAVAADSIDEIFVMIPAWGNPPEGSGLSLHLHGLEGGEWTITLPPEGPQVVHEHVPADIKLTGTASDLALLLFQRPTIGPVDRAGEAAALDAWYREFLFD